MKPTKLHLAIGMAVALCPVAASADVVIVTHPGLKCVEHSDLSPELYYSGGNAYNDATGTNTFVCPAEKTYIYDGADSVFVDEGYWSAVVDDNNASYNFSCYLRSCNSLGTSCVNSATINSSGTGVQNLSGFGSVFASGSYTNYMYLRCTVPGKVGSASSGIKSYMTYEF